MQEDINTLDFKRIFVVFGSIIDNRIQSNGILTIPRSCEKLTINLYPYVTKLQKPTGNDKQNSYIIILSTTFFLPNLNKQKIILKMLA